jgi:hypothetical protein
MASAYSGVSFDTTESEFPSTHLLPTQVNAVFSQRRKDWLRPLRTAVVKGHTGDCIGLKNNLGWLKGR